jgi:hypothetical protein
MGEYTREYPLDFNEFTHRENEMIPVGAIVKVRMTVRNGGYGPDLILTKSRGTGALYLNTMLFVSDGPYILRRIYHRFGVYSSEYGNKWVEKGLGQLRAVLESARNILPLDESPEVQAKRRVASYKEFDGLEFVVKVGIETPKNPLYKTENCIREIITPDKAEYAQHKETQGIAWPFMGRS